MPNAVPHLTVTVQPAAKPWWRSKVLWVNAACLALAAAESQLGLLQGVLPGNVYAWLAFGLPVVNAALRFITRTELSSVAAPEASITPSPTEGQP